MGRSLMKDRSLAFGKRFGGVGGTDINFHFKVKDGIKYAVKLSFASQPAYWLAMVVLLEKEAYGHVPT